MTSTNDTTTDNGHYLQVNEKKGKSNLRTPELVSLAHQFCPSFCLYSSRFREKNQIIINLMKHGMCKTHINDYYSNYFV